VRLGPTNRRKATALPDQISQAGRVAEMEKITDVIDFAGSMLERLPQQNLAEALLFIWCGLGLVGVVRSLNRSARLQKQLNELSGDVRQLTLKFELAESRRFMEFLNSSSGPESRMRQEDASSITPPEGQRI
jgi:hypothetical protein